MPALLSSPCPAERKPPRTRHRARAAPNCAVNAALPSQPPDTSWQIGGWLPAKGQQVLGSCSLTWTRGCHLLKHPSPNERFSFRKTETLSPFQHQLSISLSPGPWHPLFYCLSESGTCRDLMSVESYKTCLLGTGLFHRAQCPQYCMCQNSLRF